MNRIAMVTGATGAIGRAIAEGLAATPGFAVVLACRDRAAGLDLAGEIQARTGNPEVSCEPVDVSRLASVRELARRWQGPLHVLVNNAAQSPRQRQQTPEGLEVQFATNVLGYHWLARELLPALLAGAPARVVNVASYWAGGLDLSDLQFVRRRYDNDAAYRQSKQANRMLTAALARRLADRAITVNSCHPGDVNSRLSNDLGFGGHESPEAGARTPLLLATGPVGGEVSGRYFAHLREEDCPFAADRDAVEALYAACERFCG